MNKSFLINNLCFMYNTIRASEHLLQIAIKRATGELKDFYEKHLVEETDHLKMLTEDLQRFGVHQVKRYRLAAQMVGEQYYYLFHDSEWLLLGYMAALECHQPSLDFVAEVEGQHGPLTCVRWHAEHDPKHAKELRAEIRKASPQLQSRINSNEMGVLNMLSQAARSF